MAWIEKSPVSGLGVLSILLAASLTGQDLPRDKALGEVRNKDGKLWVGAKVCMVSWPEPGSFWGKPDRVEVQTDDHGRFRAQILEGRV
jgi:hypothetical protein